MRGVTKEYEHHGDGSPRQLANGTWEIGARVEGKRVYAYGRTVKEARAKLRVKIGKIERGVDPTYGKRPLRDFLAAWLATEPGNTPKGRESYRWAVEVHIIPRIGDIRVDKLTEADVERLMRQAMTTPLPPARVALSPRSATIVRNTLRAALNWGIRARYLTENVAATAKAPAARSRRAQPLSETEAARLLAAVEGTRWHALYLVALRTGLRQGELLGLRWTDVDLAAARIHVRQQAQYVAGEWIVVRALKTESAANWVPLTHDAALALVGHRERQAVEREIAPDWEEHGLVFPATNGRLMSSRNLFRRWVRDRAAAGLSDRRFHDLRASTATLLHARGVPMRTIQRILRHARMSTTADLYAVVFDDALHDAVGRLDGMADSAIAPPFARASETTAEHAGSDEPSQAGGIGRGGAPEST